MADPVVSSGDTAIADPSQSRSPFDALASNASSSRPVPPHVPAGASASPPVPDPFESMLKQAGDIMSGKTAPDTTEAAPPVESKPTSADAKTKPNLPPPIKNTQAKESAPEPGNQLTQDDLESMPFEKWPRSAQDWKTAKDAAAKQAGILKKQISELQEQLKVGTPEVKSLLQERDQLRQELRSISIERDPEFKAKYDAAFGAVRSQLESMFGKDDADKAIELFGQAPTAARVKALEKFSEEMSPIKQSALAAALIEHDKHSRMRSMEISEASKNWDKLQMEGKLRSETAAQERSDAFRRALQETFSEWTDAKNGYGFLKRTGDAKADQHLDEMFSLADVILTGENSPDEMSRAALYAAMSPRLLTVLGERDAKIAELESKLKALSGASPGVAQGDLLSSGDSSASSGPIGYGDAIAQAVMQSGLMRR